MVVVVAGSNFSPEVGRQQYGNPLVVLLSINVVRHITLEAALWGLNARALSWKLGLVGLSLIPFLMSV